MPLRGSEYLTSETKRQLDVWGGTVLSALILPAAAASSVVSAVDTRCLNPFFTQERQGPDGNNFTTVKLRTIKKALSETAFVTLGTFDPRATKAGLLLRQSGLDEWPQLLNVFRGEMSLVGPRPLVSSDLEKRHAVDGALFDDWYDGFYTVAKPGLTGPSQIYRHGYLFNSDELLERSMVLDLEYREEASLRADMHILVATPVRMLRANAQIIDNRAVS